MVNVELLAAAPSPIATAVTDFAAPLRGLDGIGPKPRWQSRRRKVVMPRFAKNYSAAFPRHG